MKTNTLLLTALASIFAVAAGSYGLAPIGGAHAQAPAGAMADAEVRKIDREAKKITLRHGEIKHLDMPPMTMVFQVKDAALLDKVQPGDKVRFAAEKAGGAYVVTAIEPAK